MDDEPPEVPDKHPWLPMFWLVVLSAVALADFLLNVVGHWLPF